MKKKGVLLINVGTPDEPTVKSIRNYLREFLLDPDVIDAPYIIRQLLVRIFMSNPTDSISSVISLKISISVGDKCIS